MTFDDVSYVGTGFLTTDYVLMTAGHCIYDEEKKVFARLVELYFGINQRYQPPISLDGPLSDWFQFKAGYITGVRNETKNDICWIDLKKYLPQHRLDQLPQKAFILDHLSSAQDSKKLYTICGNNLIFDKNTY